MFQSFHHTEVCIMKLVYFPTMAMFTVLSGWRRFSTIASQSVRSVSFFKSNDCMTTSAVFHVPSQVGLHTDTLHPDSEVHGLPARYRTGQFWLSDRRSADIHFCIPEHQADSHCLKLLDTGLVGFVFISPELSGMESRLHE